MPQTTAGRILVDLYSTATYRFFRRLATTLGGIGFETHYITHSIDVYTHVKRAGDTVFLCLRRHAASNPSPTAEPADRGLSDRGLISRGAVCRLYRATLGLVSRLHARHPYSHVFIFSGILPSQMALGDFAARHGIARAFFEIGNMPGKIFVDPEGTNAWSRLFREPALLDRFPVPDADYRAWRETYLAGKRQTHHVPQASAVDRARTPRAIVMRQLVYVANALSGVAHMPKLRHIDRWARLMRRPLALKFDVFDPESSGYLFFPMQVKMDAQLLLHSDLAPIEAVRAAREEARRRGLRFVVKPHPAESDPSIPAALDGLRREIGCAIVDTNTFELLRHATRVVTVNSTVGLEGLILNRPVGFFGRSLFAHFIGRDDYLRAYLLGYLIDADFFADIPITTAAACAVLARAALGIGVGTRI